MLNVICFEMYHVTSYKQWYTCNFQVGRLYWNNKTIINSAEVCGKSCIAVFHHTVKSVGYIHSPHAVEPACKNWGCW